ncbi:G-type lectin S-receptor-like serine/threonine-protein kinase LECRK1 [Coffea eugenioides]|uniref:Receptor-like serine/threonine-protein kinase n=1 Tax=Coffea arabica TaxID=13443 RepID=A0A6P6TEF8_COFAR|nr:G-type lectin S-receptor-like serine/threonine-protein kinase LECRK1 [Coffea arabica]XP_027178322.1 G-type lectin S-receptor-like serine/threonine-protein kinase LECRK1 [Coffea eugenioides]
MAFFIVAVYLSFLLATTFEAAKAQPDANMIGLGATLYPSSQPWYSPSKRFAFGFFPEGSGFRVGIRIVGSANNVTVWTAQRDDPAVSSSSSLGFIDGKLQLKYEQGQLHTIADPSKPASYASMLDSGNFVLYDQYKSIIWESFIFPTDTILGGQALDPGKELISSLSPIDHPSGRFHLKMQYDGNLVAYPADSADDSVDSYWNTGTMNNPKTKLILTNVTGKLLLADATGTSVIQPVASPLSRVNGSLYRATLGYDGNFRLFSHSFDAEGKSNMSTEWEAIADLCDVKGFCGYNSYCSRIDGEPQCFCMPGYSFTDLNETSGGCERNFTGSKCILGKEDASHINMTSLNVGCDDRPYFLAPMREKEDCNHSCLEDCDCDAAIYSEPTCSKYKLPLKYLKNTTGTVPSIAFFKLSIDISRSLNGDTQKQPWSTILALSLSFVTYSCIILAVFTIFIFKFRILKYRKLLFETRTTGLMKGFTLRTYTYNELKKATKGFNQELGRGGFGAVHKGTFDKGRSFVAVKRLEKVVEEGEREFRAEMRVIGRTRHRNLVRLLGYCIEGSKRLLVYEYMSNGSLADLLFKGQWRPNWDDRVRIALDVARGILYLHEECESAIIHCDIKPQNILLDESWRAKISDFGIAKLLMPEQTRTNTHARGTRGYIAPEWFKNVPISVKVDIYSFGIVLLEIVCCRKNLAYNLSRPEETLLPAWAYKCFEANELGKLIRGEEVDRRTFERMVTVALWCIQDEPALRFPMKTVMMMLEGIIDVPIPPCPSDEFSVHY